MARSRPVPGSQALASQAASCIAVPLNPDSLEPCMPRPRTPLRAVKQARRALTPLLVPHEDLPLSATLDAFGWSLMAALGASIGGIAVSWLGAQPGPFYNRGLGFGVQGQGQG